MTREQHGFTAVQTREGYKIHFHDAKEEIELSQKDINEFASRYAVDMLNGRSPEYSEREELMLSLLEIALIPDTTVH